jgi:GxxExxY protein
LLLEGALTERIIGSAIEVHRDWGRGYWVGLPHLYRAGVRLRGIRYRYEVDLPVVYKGVKHDCGYRMDFVVEEKVVIELKAVDKLIPVHEPSF